MTTVKKRIDLLDIAKGLGIITVIMCQTIFNDTAQILIYSFHMPLFFIISGMLFNPEKYKSFGTFIKSKLKSLICPYVLFCLFGLMFNSIRQFSACPSIKDFAWWLLISFKDIIWAPYSSDNFHLINTPLWFVPCLLLTEILYYFISKIKNKPLMLLVIALLCAFGWFTESDYCPVDFTFLPWNFSSACFVLAFYAAGNLTFGTVKKTLVENNSDKKRIFAVLAVFVLAAVLNVWVALINGKISIGSRELNNGLLLLITGFSGSTAIICLSRFLVKCRFLKFCGTNSFIIMGSHVII